MRLQKPAVNSQAAVANSSNKMPRRRRRPPAVLELSLQFSRGNRYFAAR
jgi:hypothetical protein